MSAWDKYENRISVKGPTKRGAAYKREVRMLNTKMQDSLSFTNAEIDGVARSVAIIDSDNLNEKKMFSVPGEDINCGAMVHWKNNYWIVTEKDANNEIYTRTKLLQCNHLLKWVDDDNVIREQWCVIEDGTKLRILVSA